MYKTGNNNKNIRRKIQNEIKIKNTYFRFHAVWLSAGCARSHFFSLFFVLVLPSGSYCRRQSEREREGEIEVNFVLDGDKFVSFFFIAFFSSLFSYFFFNRFVHMTMHGYALSLNQLFVI